MGTDRGDPTGSVAVRLAAFAAGAAVFCQAAAGTNPARLALMPLPREALGPDAAGFVLARDSGVDSNADAARNAGGGVTGAELARDGRITGYTLDYAVTGLSAPGAAPSLLGVQTIAELYRDGAAARKGLAFWRGVTRALNGSTANGLTVGLVPFVARVGDGAFAFELTYRRAGTPVLYIGDVVFRAGDLLGAVFVTARTKASLHTRTIGLARRLATRMQRVVAGETP